MNKKTTDVKCIVQSCKHNKEHSCDLEVLNIGFDSNKNFNQLHKCDTICNNFLKK